jgi:hypothetical protein
MVSFFAFPHHQEQESLVPKSIRNGSRVGLLTFTTSELFSSSFEQTKPEVPLKKAIILFLKLNFMFFIFLLRRKALP